MNLDPETQWGVGMLQLLDGIETNNDYSDEQRAKLDECAGWLRANGGPATRVDALGVCCLESSAACQAYVLLVERQCGRNLRCIERIGVFG